MYFKKSKTLYNEREFLDFENMNVTWFDPAPRLTLWDFRTSNKYNTCIGTSLTFIYVNE